MLCRKRPCKNGVLHSLAASRDIPRLYLMRLSSMSSQAQIFNVEWKRFSLRRVQCIYAKRVFLPEFSNRHFIISSENELGWDFVEEDRERKKRDRRRTFNWWEANSELTNQVKWKLDPMYVKSPTSEYSFMGKQRCGLKWSANSLSSSMKVGSRHREKVLNLSKMVLELVMMVGLIVVVWSNSCQIGGIPKWFAAVRSRTMRVPPQKVLP